MTEISESLNQFIWFGDGSEVKFVSMKTQIDKKGRTIFRFILKPSKNVIFKYSLNESTDLSQEGYIIRNFPLSVVEILDYDPNHFRIIICSDLNNRKTPYMRRYAKYLDEIQHLEQLNTSLSGRVARLHEEYQILSQNVEENISRNVTIINKAREGSQQIRGKDSDMTTDDYEE